MKNRKEDNNMKNLEKILWVIAKATRTSTSLSFLYEPKVPDKLLNKKPKKEK